MVANYVATSNLPGLRWKRFGTMDKVASNGRAVFECPTGDLSYHSLALRPLTSAGAEATEANIDTEIGGGSGYTFVKADSIELVRMDYNDYKATQEFYLPSLYGNGWSEFCFTMPWLESQASQNATRLGTADVDNLTIEVPIGTLSTVASIEVWGLCRFGERRPLGRTLRRISHERSDPGAIREVIRKVFDVEDKGRAQAKLLTALHFDDTNADELLIRVGGDEIHRLPKRALTQAYAKSGRTPNGSYSHYDFTSPRNDTIDTFPINKAPFEVEIDWTGGAPGAHQLLMETIEGNQPEAAAA